MPISIRLDPEVHCAVVRRITVFRVAREQCKRHEPLAAVRVSEPIDLPPGWQAIPLRLVAGEFRGWRFSQQI